MADLEDLIGTPFKIGGRGPDFYDCYGLVMEMAKRNGQTLPDVASNTNQAINAAAMGAHLPMWRQVQKAPQTVVLFRIGRLASHVGYMINQDQMIHAWDQSNGVSIVNIDTWQHRIVGFYEYVGI